MVEPTKPTKTDGTNDLIYNEILIRQFKRQVISAPSSTDAYILIRLIYIYKKTVSAEIHLVDPTWKLLNKPTKAAD